MFRKGVGPGFFNRCGEEQIRRVIGWLGKGVVPLHVQATGWVLPHRVDFPGRIMLAAMNLNLDAWEKLEFTATITQRVRRVRLLTKGDRFVPVPSRSWQHRGGVFQISVKSHVPMLEVVGVAVELAPV